MDRLRLWLIALALLLFAGALYAGWRAGLEPPRPPCGLSPLEYRIAGCPAEGGGE